MKKKKVSLKKRKTSWLPAKGRWRTAAIVGFVAIVGVIGIIAISRGFAYSNGFVYFNQKDTRWANKPYPYIPGTRDQSDIAISRSGCGPTSMAMVASSLSRSTNPADIAAWYGKRFHTSNGTMTEVYPTFAKDFGLKQAYLGDFRNGPGRQAIQNRLKTGRSLVIIHAGPGYFTRSGHIIVLRDYNSKTKQYLVADPNNSGNNRWFYDVNLIKDGNLSYAYGFTR